MSVRDTTILNHTELKYLLLDSLKEYSENVIFISGNNPYQFSINKKIFYILIKNVHESGSGRPNQDECRIQIARTANFLTAKNSGKPVLFLGYFADLNVFTAWNPHLLTERINQRQTISAYSRFTIQKNAAKNGISIYKDNKDQVIISIQPKYIGLYLENYDLMHQSDEDTLLELIKKSDSVEETESEESTSVEIERKKFSVTHARFRRDMNFKKLVTETYSHRCAVCGMQLEVVEAAHIIPHSHDKGTDDPKNGICLCALHHKAYDNGLIYFDGEYNIRINDDKIRYLEKVHKDGGISKFTGLQYDKLTMPSSRLFFPEPEFIKIGNAIRGISE